MFPLIDFSLLTPNVSAGASSVGTPLIPPGRSSAGTAGDTASQSKRTFATAVAGEDTPSGRKKNFMFNL